MTSAEIGRSRHSYLGMASFLLSFFPVVLLLGVDRLVLFAINTQPPGADEVGYAFGMFVLATLTALAEIAALGLGVAGMLQRQRRRLFAFLGVACSVLALVYINAQEVGFEDIASFIVGMTETQPQVVSPKNQ